MTDQPKPEYGHAFPGRLAKVTAERDALTVRVAELATEREHGIARKREQDQREASLLDDLREAERTIAGMRAVLDELGRAYPTLVATIRSALEKCK